MRVLYPSIQTTKLLDSSLFYNSCLYQMFAVLDTQISLPGTAVISRPQTSILGIGKRNSRVSDNLAITRLEMQVHKA